MVNIKEYPMTDIGSSRLFADVYRDRLKFVREMGLYFYFNGQIWEKDLNFIYAKRLAKKFAIKAVECANSIEDDKLREIAVKYYSKFNGFNQREKLIKDAQSVYIVDFKEFNNNPHLYNCKNGTIDLNTGEIHEHKPEDMLTQISNVTYREDARCERWERFIDEVMEGDEMSKRLLQMIAGYSLSGSTKFECFFLLYGKTTRNGKGTYNSVMYKMHGDYSKVLHPDSLAVKMFQNNSEAPNESIASLAGARYVSVSEPGENLVLNSDLIKQLTGRDPIKARFLRQNSFVYDPEFKIVINTNYLPKVTDQTVFSSDRLVIVEFPKHFDAETRDTHLKDKLLTDRSLSGVFNWCLQGYKMLQESGGFVMPEKTKRLFEEYRSECDTVQLFIDECLIREDGARTKCTAVYSRYKDWAIENGFAQCNKSTLMKRLKAKGMLIDEYIGQKRLFDFAIYPDYHN